MNVSYSVKVTPSEVQLISSFMKQEKFTVTCVDEYFKEYGMKLGKLILMELKKNRELCKHEVDEHLTLSNFSISDSNTIHKAFI